MMFVTLVSLLSLVSVMSVVPVVSLRELVQNTGSVPGDAYQSPILEMVSNPALLEK